MQEDKAGEEVYKQELLSWGATAEELEKTPFTEA